MATYLEIYNAWKATDGTVFGRAMVAMGKYAHWILNGGSQDANRRAWATAALINTEVETRKIMWGVAGDPAFQEHGAAITDAQLQSAVEVAVDSIVPTVS